MITERELVARIENLEATHLRHWVERGWIVPLRSDDEFVFDDHDVVRAQLICDLVQDMVIETDSVPVVLSLLDQLHGTRRMLRAMATAIEKQDAAVQAAILDEIKASGLIAVSKADAPLGSDPHARRDRLKNQPPD